MSNAVTVLNAALEGRYTIERELGEGGMATVYLADDLKHGRKVALKLLKPQLAAVVGAERFLVEIKTTANLQHPHILPLFDSGEVDGLLYYIMPFIDGESLSDKLKRETQLSVKEALGITEALAGALDYAHRHGVVHRDIKPGNILLQEGQPLVADFGIALAVTVAAGDRITETGLSLGTPPYMSPEQAAAERELDGRSDQYSLACVLYEMLAGQPPFNAPTAQATVAQILAVDPPPLLERRRTVPAGVATAVHRALEKVPADRFDTAGDFAEAVTTGEYWTPVEVRGAGAASPSQSPALVRTTGAALVAVGALALWGWLRPGPPTTGTAGVQRTVIPLPAGHQLSIPQGGALPFALSPDGSLLVYAGVREGRTSLYLRPLDSFESTELAGTEGARQPFFSWDGTQIGFFANRQLQRVPVDGGAPFQIVEVPGVPQGASWGLNDTIVYSARTERVNDTNVSRTREELWKVPAAGGEPVPFGLQLAGTQDAGAPLPRLTWPYHLPDGEHLLISFGDNGPMFVASLASGELTPAVDGIQAQYLPGARSSGHIIYREPGERVRAVAFDLASLQVTGDPFPLFENVFRGAQSGGSFIRVSRTGSAVYVAGGFERSLLLVERTGREVLLTEERLGYRFPRFSPDGTRVSVAVDPRPSTLWLFDVGSGVGSPIEGYQLSFWNSANGRLYAGQTFLVERWPLTSTPDTAMIWPVSPIFIRSWSRDGLTLVAAAPGLDTGQDLWHVQLGGDGVADTLMATPFEERDAKLSPDGNWLAYESDLSGRPEIYLTTYPDLRDRQRVSPAGGNTPLWAHDGSEIYYRSGDRVMAVQVSLGSSASVSQPVVLFRGNYDNSQPAGWDVDAQGRFLMVRPAPGTFGQFQVVTNLAAELAGVR